MKPFFSELFEYNFHCNQRLADVFTAHPDRVPEIALKLFSHVLNAHNIWNNRIEKGPTASFAVWQIHLNQEFKIIDQANYEKTLPILQKFDLSETIHYSNSKGQAFRSSVQDILFHIINHSTYHRAQIATVFRQAGIEPVGTDYIFFKR